MALSEPAVCSHPLFAAAARLTEHSQPGMQDSSQLLLEPPEGSLWHQHRAGMSSGTEGNWGRMSGGGGHGKKETEEGSWFSFFFTASLSGCVRAGSLVLGQ